jgi:anti-sigma28 factor (negative regulator of flagellin synthesis)
VISVQMPPEKREKRTKIGANMSQGDNEKPQRKRGFTSVALQWIAERLRRSDQIKTELADGTYKVDSAKVAEALVNKEEGRSHHN